MRVFHSLWKSTSDCCVRFYFPHCFILIVSFIGKIYQTNLRMLACVSIELEIFFRMLTSPAHISKCFTRMLDAPETFFFQTLLSRWITCEVRRFETERTCFINKIATVQLSNNTYLPFSAPELPVSLGELISAVTGEEKQKQWHEKIVQTVYDSDECENNSSSSRKVFPHKVPPARRVTDVLF